MKYDRNWKVQIATSDWDSGREYREVFYRILPSELPLHKRIFCRNPWYKFYYAMLTQPTFGYYYNAKDYHTILRKLTTFGDVMDYLNKEKEKQIKRYNRALENGKIWGDEYN